MKHSSLIAAAMFVLLATGAAFYASCSGGDSNPTGDNNSTNELTPAQYFGLIPGRTITAGYANYISDSLRHFVPNNVIDAWTFAPVIGALTTYHGHLAYPVSGAPVRRGETTPDYTFILYFSADTSGLYWYGGSYCGLDIPLAAPAKFAPYPLLNGDHWQTVGHAETDIDQCDRSIADTLNATCQRITNATVRGTTYPEVFLIRMPFIDVPGHIGTRYYEVWLAPGYGPVRAASFLRPDSIRAAYEYPKEGFEFISYSH